MAGEICKGVRDGLTPDIRVQSNGTLYDSTTNDLNNPIMWITYHDAQAYPVSCGCCVVAVVLAVVSRCSPITYPSWQEYFVEFKVAAYG